MVTLTWEYIAGFVDGEGCIRAHYRNSKIHRPMCVLDIGQSEKNKEVLYILEKFTKNSGINCHINTKQNKGKSYVTFRIGHHKHLLTFLKKIYPFLITKKFDAGIVIAYIENRNWRPYVQNWRQ